MIILSKEILSRIKNRIENWDICFYYYSIILVLSATAYTESSVWKFQFLVANAMILELTYYM